MKRPPVADSPFAATMLERRTSAGFSLSLNTPCPAARADAVAFVAADILGPVDGGGAGRSDWHAAGKTDAGSWDDLPSSPWVNDDQVRRLALDTSASINLIDKNFTLAPRHVYIFNQAGKPRLIKNYVQMDLVSTQNLMRTIFSLVVKRPDSACNFLETSGIPMLDGDHKVIYRVGSESGSLFGRV